jgi:hypothetical protein
MPMSSRFAAFAAPLVLALSSLSHTEVESPRPLTAAEMENVIGGATIDIAVPSSATNTTTIDNPIIGYYLEWGGATSDTVGVWTYVNGTKTQALTADHDESRTYNEQFSRVPFPPASKLNFELKYCYNSNSNCPIQPSSTTSLGYSNKTSYSYSTKMKLGAVNFWHGTVGSTTASYSITDELDAVDSTSKTKRLISTDTILAAERMSTADQFGLGINCSYNNVWQFTYRQAKTLSLGSDAKCLRPSITMSEYPDPGPSPSCPDFGQRVSNALAAQDSSYGSYVNVVVVNDILVFDSKMKKYISSPAGFHPGGAKWVAIKAGSGSMLGAYIVHEWGHQVGLDHEPAANCTGSAKQSVMCIVPGWGVSKAFCDKIASYTGTKNFNPNH